MKLATANRRRRQRLWRTWSRPRNRKRWQPTGPNRFELRGRRPTLYVQFIHPNLLAELFACP